MGARRNARARQGLVWGVVWVCIAITAGVAAAQTACSAATPAYDVATIRRSGEGGWPDADTTADSYIARNVTLKMLLEDAYGIRRQWITGIPKALESVRFDVQAKVVDPEPIRNLKDEQRAAMLLQVLTERFHLTAHKETRILPLYDLVVSPRGPKLKEATKQSMDNADLEIRRRMLTGTGQPMTALANALTSVLNRGVLDKTGLPGSYDFTLRWTPDGNEDASDVMAPPTIMDALDVELGLRLRPDKGPVTVVVVDSAEMPSEN